MYNADYSSLPYQQQPLYPETQNPDRSLMEPAYHAPPAYASASAPPYSPRGYNHSLPPLADYSAPYHVNSPVYGPAQADTQPTAPSFSQPQSSYSLPQFEVHGNYRPPFHTQDQPEFPSYVPPSDQPAPPSYLPNLDPNPVPNYAPFNHPSLYTGFTKPYDPQYENQDVSLSRGRSDTYSGYGSDLGYGSNEGVYAYRGASEPYGARGTASKSSTWSGFDDFGRPIGYSSSSGKEPTSNSGTKVVRAVPKVDTQEDANGGAQKFRVKLLAESGGQSTMDVLCQIGLDGVRMLEPSTGRILRIYLLDSITKCEAIDTSTFAFWSKSSVDIEPRRIRLQSNRYTTSTILDMVTASIVQFKEIGESSRSSEHPQVAEQPQEKKKGFGDFINLIKPINEEKDHWVPDEAVSKCIGCGTDFNAFNRKHHCRNCGDIFCDKCTQGRTALTADDNAPVVRVCDRCLGEVSRRLSYAKEATTRSTAPQSHQELAKKLQEELERSCKVSSGSGSYAGKRMIEVACPTCTVHLQVQAPSSGSETIECGVCQRPFLVTS